MSAPAHFIIMTAAAPGAIGIIQLHGPGAADVLRRLIGREPPAHSFLADLGGIDEGLMARMPEGGWQLMPHGGPRVMQRLAERLRELGAEAELEPSPRDLYPEAASAIEADMLAALARAASPAAIELLLTQPERWREAAAASAQRDDIDAAAVVRTTAALDHLVTPPTVVLVGRANVGKSTLSNLVIGRAASITADLPGTTRDWVAGLAELPTEIGELAVRWFDTPGIRDSDDPLEQRSIELARAVVAAADVLIAMRDLEIGWPDAASLPRTPDLWMMNKADLGAPELGTGNPELGTAKLPLRISAARGWGLDELAASVGRVLGLGAEGSGEARALWAFSPSLKRIVREAGWAELREYVEEAPSARLRPRG